MSNSLVQILVAAFDDANSAEEALNQVKVAKKEKVVDVQGAIMVHKDATGNKIDYKDVGLTPGKGAVGGVILGAVVGILTGGSGLVLGAAGALLGGFVGRKKQESLLPSDQVNKIVTRLKPGAAAIMMVIDPSAATALESRLKPLGADLFTINVSADVARQMQAHQNSTPTDEGEAPS